MRDSEVQQNTPENKERSTERSCLTIDVDPDKDHVEIYTSDGVIEIRNKHGYANRRKIVFYAPKHIKIKRIGRTNATEKG